MRNSAIRAFGRWIFGFDNSRRSRVVGGLGWLLGVRRR
jgi:hypothetical protein